MKPHPTNPNRNEASWVRFLADLWGPSGTEFGIGDDCAILPAARYAISTDALAEGVDFERAWATPEALGLKALAENLSDLAASGAAPKFLMLALGIPPGVEDAWIEGVLRGMHDLGVQEGIGLAGGDLSASASGLFLSLTVLGMQEFPPLLRSGGKPGDILALGGPLGGARAGLALLQAGRTLPYPRAGACASEEDRLIRRFYEPPSQSALGLFLARSSLATCCIDLSDGFSADLEKICAASGCGAEVDAKALPLETGIERLAPPGESGLECALRGGEDQVLLFAVSPDRVAELAGAPAPVSRVGRLTSPDGGIRLVGADGSRTAMSGRGYDHFRA